MRRLPAIMVVALLLTALAGCASAPREAATRYLLVNDAARPAPAADAAGTLAVGPVRLARFLAVEGIVMQTSDVAIHEARNHLWAEDLATQLERTLRRQLARALPDVRVREGGKGPRLTVDVDRFQGRYDGMAVVAGEWELIDADGEAILARPFHVEEALTSDGYAALVSSLEAAWRQVGDSMAETLMAEWPAAAAPGA